MQSVIQYIEKELDGLYPKREISAFTRLILEHVCQLDYTQTLINRDKILSLREKEIIEMIIERLKVFEPIQYILGKTEFYGLELKVNSDTLIPRPETEELVEWVIENISNKTPSVLDIGTGSGCIALAIKKAMPGAHVLATDFSEKAIKVAKENALTNQLDVKIFDTNILKWENYAWGKYDIIVSNPPYIRESEKKDMHSNVLDYEPDSALFVSDFDPLLFYRRIGEFALKYLKENGLLFFEINENLGNEMVALLSELGFRNLEIKKDMHNKERMLCCRLK